MIKAPSVSSLEIEKLSSHQIKIRWDNAGENFWYNVEHKLTKTKDGLPSSQGWQSLGYTNNNLYYTDQLSPLQYYKFRVQTVGEGFTPSDWVETEEIQTFEQSVFNFTQMQQLYLSDNFITRKFKNQEKVYDFSKDIFNAALMNEQFEFSPYYSNISAISNYIIQDDEFHEIQGDVSKVCKDVERVYLLENQGLLYLFERYQPIVKVSNDKGQTWKAIKLLNDRAGYPLARTIHYQNQSSTFVLGYDKLFYGRRSSDIRWSADDVRFSSQDITFVKVGKQFDIGFDLDIFATYATLPAEITKKAEAIAANDEFIYVVAKDVVRKIKAKNAPIDTNKISAFFGERIFERASSRITNNPRAVTFKMDSIGGFIFALVTGETRTNTADPRDPKNVIDSASKGVYKLDPKTDRWKRVFGNTAEERRRIEHGYTNMSVSADELFISSSNFSSLTEEMAIDQELIDTNPHVNYAVKYGSDHQYLHDKHYHMMTFRTNENSEYERFVPGRMKYYAEAWFSSNRHSKTQSWINNLNQVVVVYHDYNYTKIIDKYSKSSPSRIMKEIHNMDKMKVISPNIEFSGFNKFSNGIVIYHGESGDVVGYFKFDYRTIGVVEIIWSPAQIMFEAELVHQKRKIPWGPTQLRKEKDPDLRPLLKSMVPDSYLLEDSNFEKFCEYYLQFISDGYGTHYNKLLNLVKTKYPREKDSWQYFWSEVYKRNIYLDKKKREEVSKFFESRKNDFYSAKGTEASYKFLFKMLYNEEVEIDIESNNTSEYLIVVNSDNITQDLVGRTIYTPTGRCNVTCLEKVYSNKGQLQWGITIHNMIGQFIEGQEILCETKPFTGMIIKGVQAKDLAANKLEYINRSRSYYTMKIKSTLPTSRYREDILRFVHPVGFGFIGITLLVIFINSGLSLKHVETIINKFKNYKWSDGLPSHYPDRVALLSYNDEISKSTITDEPKYDPHRLANTVFPLPPEYLTENPGLLHGKNADKRRTKLSATFDSSSITFCNWRDLIDQRIKSDVGNPRDRNTNQIKV